MPGKNGRENGTAAELYMESAARAAPRRDPRRAEVESAANSPPGEANPIAVQTWFANRDRHEAKESPA